MIGQTRVSLVILEPEAGILRAPLWNPVYKCSPFLPLQRAAFICSCSRPRLGMSCGFRGWAAPFSSLLRRDHGCGSSGVNGWGRGRAVFIYSHSALPRSAVGPNSCPHSLGHGLSLVIQASAPRTPSSAAPRIFQQALLPAWAALSIVSVSNSRLSVRSPTNVSPW